MRTSGGKIFIHCQAGVSRSATIVIAYIMTMEHKRLADAYEFAHVVGVCAFSESYFLHSFVKSKRLVVSPNLGFMGQLIKYERTLFPDLPDPQ